MDVVERLQAASQAREAVTIVYLGGSQPGTKRQVTPIRVEPPYLIAYDHANDAERTFRLDKIQITAGGVGSVDYVVLPPDEEMPPHVPTQRQLNYAKDLGVRVSEGATRREVSDMISFALADDEPTGDEDRRYADHYGVEYTRYTGRHDLFDRIFDGLGSPGRERELCTWFTYRVYRQIVGHPPGPPTIGLGHPGIHSVSEEIVNDESVVRSIRKYSGSGLLRFGESTCAACGSYNTIAYKRTSALLREMLGLPSRSDGRKEACAGNGPSQVSPGGCCVLAILALLAPAAITAFRLLF